MNKYFDIKDSLYSLTEKHPVTIDILVENGFNNLKDSNKRKLMGESISIETACKSKGINIELMEKLLVGAIEQSLEEKTTKASDEAVLVEGVLPCPVRVPLMEKLEEYLNQEDIEISSYLKSANVGVEWIREKINKSSSEELADIYLSAGFDLFFDRDLMGKHTKDGVFKDITPFDTLNKDFQNDNISLKDPNGVYSIIGVVPAVFLVNTEELNGSPMPRSWKDLLSGEFEKRVSLPLMDFDLFNALLLSIYKEFGMEGIEKLGKAHFRSMSPAEMVKSNVRNTERGIPTVTIMPYLFTKMVKENGPLKLVWPEEGAVISPIFLLTKNNGKKEIQKLTNFFTSKKIGQMMVDNGAFPSTNPEVDNHLNKNQGFIWLGWDYINEHDNLAQELKLLMDIFDKAKGEI